MDWHEERERLLADTLAFVQQVTGEILVFAVKAKVPLSPAIEAAARQLRRYHAAPKPKQIAELRQELGAMFEAFDNMQRALHPRTDVPASANGTPAVRAA